MQEASTYYPWPTIQRPLARGDSGSPRHIVYGPGEQPATACKRGGFVEAELVTLVGTGATTVVGLMATDAWEQAKRRLARLFAHSGGADTVAGELEESRTTLAAATGTAEEEDLTSDLTGSLRFRLRRLLEQNPNAARELQDFVDEFAPVARPDLPGTVHNSITGGTQHGPVLQGHTFTNLTFHGGGDTAAHRAS
ncbi:hypothetical protein OG586_08750 [Streptomyces murinus]|uniref:hypothetical protein n=1 Tax=Streptomyces murinus TaxID=33900 RepID=UPI002E801C0E|nr:hypothetical protein [Streptomyces murinus]WUD06305.1 hypothetical protein OG586_08750 [Streptomyces murinus]